MYNIKLLYHEDNIATVAKHLAVPSFKVRGGFWGDSIEAFEEVGRGICKCLSGCFPGEARLQTVKLPVSKYGAQYSDVMWASIMWSAQALRMGAFGQQAIYDSPFGFVGLPNTIEQQWGYFLLLIEQAL